MATDNVAAQFDYFSPFLSARIITPNAEYPLWTRVDPHASAAHSEDQASEIQALSYLNQIQVESNLGQIPIITATLTPPYPDAIKLIDSGLVEYGKNRLQVQFGYARGPEGTAVLSDVMEGLMMVPEVSYGADITITLKAQGVFGGYVDTAKGAGRTFNNKERIFILRVLCEEQGLDLVFDESADAISTAAMRTEVNVAQGWRTNLLMMRIVANQANCYMLYQGKSVKFIPRSKLYAKTEPFFTFFLYGSMTGQSTTALPIFSAQVSGQNAMWVGGLGKAIAQEIEMESRTNQKTVVDDSTVKPGQSGSEVADIKADGTATAAPKEEENAHMLPLPGDRNAKDFPETSKAAFSSWKASGMAITVNVDSIGVPNLVPGMCVAVQGLGHRLDTGQDRNKYGVHKVTHTIGADGFTTSAMIISNTAKFVSKQLGIFGTGPINDIALPKEKDPGTVEATPQVDDLTSIGLPPGISQP